MKALTPQEAAQRFIDLVIGSTFDDALDLTDRVGLDNDAIVHLRKARYEDVEAAVRRQFQATHDLDALEVAVPRAVPKKHRSDVASAVAKLMGAVYEELTVKQQAGYVLGLAVGRELRPHASARIGAGWTPSRKGKVSGRRKG